MAKKPESNIDGAAVITDLTLFLPKELSISISLCLLLRFAVIACIIFGSRWYIYSYVIFFCPCSVAFHKLHCSSVLHLYCHYQCLSYTEYLELNSLIGYGYESRLAEVEPWTSSKCLSAVGIINMPLDHLWFWILALGSHSSALVSFTPHGSLWSLNHNTALSWCWSFLMESMNMKSISFASRLETLRFDLYSRVSYKIRMGLGGLPVVVAYSDSFISPHFPSPRWSFLCALNINKVVMTLYHSIWF